MLTGFLRALFRERTCTGCHEGEATRGNLCVYCYLQVQKLGRWRTISMVMRYAHHHPASLRAGVEILDRVPTGVSTNLAQSPPHTRVETGPETVVSG